MKTKKDHLIKFPLRIRLKMRLSSSKLLTFLIQVLPTIGISVATTFIFINQYANITKTTSLFSDPVFTGLLGSLIGACVGSLVAGIISFQLHKESLSSASAVKDKEEIYKVLYDGLIKFRASITSTEDRYHTFFIFDASDPGISSNDVIFIEWDQIKNDSRIIQIPRWLKNIFDKYFVAFAEYQELVQIAVDEIITIKSKLSEDEGLHYRLIGSDDYYLLGLMNHNSFYLQHALQFEEDFREGDDNLKGVDLTSLNEHVKDVYFRLTSIEKTKYFYADFLVKNTDQMISILSHVIRYINDRYENQDDVI